ncbi:MAG: tetratricopeptide repeat protein [Sedimentisphaerales bacterium]
MNGIMYERGLGTTADYSEAKKWYLKSAQCGLPWGQYNLARMYAEGIGTPVDYNEARRWYQKAAQQGLCAAQINLSWMYYEGKWMKIDYVEAYKWLMIADKKCGSNYRGVYNAKNKVILSMTPDQIIEAKERAEKFVVKLENPDYDDQWPKISR